MGSFNGSIGVTPSDIAYAASWDGNPQSATKDAIYDKIQTIAGGAPTTATYITQTANGSLSAEQALGALGTGALWSTTTTGVVSIAATLTSLEGITISNGSLIYGTGADAVASLSAGTANYLLQANGAGAPTWVTSVTLTNVSMTGELDMTGASALIDLNPAGTGSSNVIDITPSAAIASTGTWRGVNIEGAALDPGGAGSIYGYRADFSGVSLTNEPDIEAVRIYMPATFSGQGDICGFEVTGNGMLVEMIDNDKGQNALYIDGGGISLNYTAGSDAAASYESMGIELDVASLASTAHMHGIHVNSTGSTSGEVAAISVGVGVGPVHQHIGTFVTPDQGPGVGTYAARFPDGGAWTAGIDGETVFVADNDYIYIGDAAVFSMLQVLLTTPANKDVRIKYEYYNTALAWVEFLPSDSTDGFKQNGIIEWDDTDFTNWKSDYDPGAGAGAAGYYVRLKRKRNTLTTPPVPTTIKILEPTEFTWDSSGDLSVNSVAVTTELSGPALEVVAASTDTLTAAQVSGTFITNYGQGAANTQTLPAAAAGLNFIFSAITTGNALHIKAGASDLIYLDETALHDGDKVSLATPAAADFITFFTFRSGASTWDWIATSGQGTWTDGGA